MTISTTINRVQYDGNGAASVFAAPFKFNEDEDINVILTDASGNDSTKVLDTDYSVSGAGNDFLNVKASTLEPLFFNIEYFLCASTKVGFCVLGNHHRRLVLRAPSRVREWSNNHAA